MLVKFAKLYPPFQLSPEERPCCLYLHMDGWIEAGGLRMQAKRAARIKPGSAIADRKPVWVALVSKHREQRCVIGRSLAAAWIEVNPGS